MGKSLLLNIAEMPNLGSLGSKDSDYQATKNKIERGRFMREINNN